MTTVEHIAMGLVWGVIFGAWGFYNKRDRYEDGTKEPPNWRKLFRTLVIFAVAGVLVGYAGDSITPGTVQAQAEFLTPILGKLIDEAYPNVRTIVLARLG